MMDREIFSVDAAQFDLETENWVNTLKLLRVGCGKDAVIVDGRHHTSDQVPFFEYFFVFLI